MEVVAAATHKVHARQLRTILCTLDALAGVFPALSCEVSRRHWTEQWILHECRFTVVEYAPSHWEAATLLSNFEPPNFIISSCFLFAPFLSSANLGYTAGYAAGRTHRVKS